MSVTERYSNVLNDLPAAAPEVVEAARRVELVVMDVDGVLTDGHTWQLDNGEQLLAFSVQDALSFALCEKVGLHLAVISGRDLPAARLRMGRFRMVEMHFGVVHKGPVLDEMSRRLGIPLERMAYIGDDLIDLPLLARVGLPVAVPNAVPEVRELALWCTASPGGHGAVRELITLVLKARGLYREAVTAYLREH